MSDASSEASRAGAENRSGSSSRLSLFLRSVVFDFLLVLVVSVGLAFTVSYGFNSAPDLRGDVFVTAGVCALLLACLYAGSWSKRALVFAAVAYVLVAVGVVAGISALSPEAAPMFVDGQVNDVEQNYAVYAIVLVIVPLVVYLLSRRTLGVAVLLLAGALACGFIQFLYRDWISTQPGTAAALAVYVGIGALFVLQGYRQGVLKSASVQRTSFFAAFAFGVVGALVCVGVGVGVFYGVVDALGIETVNIKPFEDYYQRPVVEYDGGYTTQLIIDPELGTSVTSDELGETSDVAEGAEDQRDEDSGGGFTLVSVVSSIMSPDNWSEMFDAGFFNIPPDLAMLLVLVPLLLIAALVGLRLYWRRRRLKKLEQRPRAEAAVELYNFFMKGFSRLKIDKPASFTPLEFAMASATELAPFTRNASKTNLLDVTLIYQRAAYGAGNVSDADWNRLKDYYNSFFEHAHARMGTFKWALRGFWRI